MMFMASIRAIYRARNIFLPVDYCVEYYGLFFGVTFGFLSILTGAYQPPKAARRVHLFRTAFEFTRI